MWSTHRKFKRLLNKICVFRRSAGELYVSYRRRPDIRYSIIRFFGDPVFIYNVIRDILQYVKVILCQFFFCRPIYGVRHQLPGRLCCNYRSCKPCKHINNTNGYCLRVCINRTLEGLCRFDKPHENATLMRFGFGRKFERLLNKIRVLSLGRCSDLCTIRRYIVRYYRL